MVSHGAAGRSFRDIVFKAPSPLASVHTQLLSVSLVSALLGEHLDNQSPGTVRYSTV